MSLAGLRRPACVRIAWKCSRAYSSESREILERHFKKIESTKDYKKSKEEQDRLVQAGRELGVPKQLIIEAYEGVVPGMSVPEKLTPQQKARIVAEDVKVFAVPEPSKFGRPFEHDDLPSAGHLQLEEHRDQRKFVRIAAYELPQLVAYAAEYKRPDSSTHPLRFKYSAFIGEDHPAARKVVLEFYPDRLGLQPEQVHKLKLLAGPRYLAEKDIVKIACERYATQAQNKRYLGEVFSRLVQSAKDPSDLFADVPLDPRPALRRQAKNKPLYPRYQFPAEWNRPDMAPKPKEDIISVLSR